MLRRHIADILLVMNILTLILMAYLAYSFDRLQPQKEVVYVSVPVYYQIPVPVENTPTVLKPVSNAPPKEVAKPKRYGFTESDIYLMAQLLCGDKSKDGDGEYDIDYAKMTPEDQKEISKVFCVIMNRIQSKRFSSTVREVILAPNQFSVMPKNSRKQPSELALKTAREWCQKYDNWDKSIQVIPESHVYFTGNGRVNNTSSTWKN